MRILLLNGPNLNLLGTREPEIYGSTTLPELETMCRGWADDFGHQLEAYQSNHEGALIDAIQGARGVFDGIVYNPAAHSHYSYALADALQAVEIPTVEIHISNIRAREEFRRHSVIEPASIYQIFGRGVDGYRHAIERLHHRAASPFTTHGHDHEDRVGDLRVPDGDGPHPVVVLFHGGYWREIWTRDRLDSLAVDLHARGYATWNVEYRRIPPIGGWRNTIGDAVDAIDAVTALSERFPLDTSDVTVLGHSAGAHLAAIASPKANLAPRRMVLIGPVLDFSEIPDEHDALPLLMGDELESHADSIDPVQHAATGIPSLVVHGTADDITGRGHSINYVEAANVAGEDSTLLEIDGADHFDIVNGRSAAWQEIVANIS